MSIIEVIFKTYLLNISCTVKKNDRYNDIILYSTIKIRIWTNKRHKVVFLVDWYHWSYNPPKDLKNKKSYVGLGGLENHRTIQEELECFRGENQSLNFIENSSFYANFFKNKIKGKTLLVSFKISWLQYVIILLGMCPHQKRFGNIQMSRKVVVFAAQLKAKNTN